MIIAVQAIEGKRDPHLAPGQEREIGRHDAHDGVGRRIEKQGCAQDVPAAKTFLPQLVADHGNTGRASRTAEAVFAGDKGAPEHGPHAQGAE